jgi:hypothetical protein
MGEYEETLEEIRKTFGKVPEFMKFFPEDLLVRDWPSWKKDLPGEIDLERARYMLNTDQFLEEMLTREDITGTRKVGFGSTGTSEPIEEISD